MDSWDLTGGTSPSDSVIAVSDHPTSALVYWLPGGNAKPCSVATTTLSKHQAARLAASINSTPPLGNGVINCPAADGSAAEVYFRFADRTVELADIDLDGCEDVVAPGLSPVGANALHPPASILLSFAPKAWRADNPMLAGH